MRKPFLLFLPCLLFIVGAMASCDEVEEVGIYDNWQARNEAFIDSIKAETGDNFVATIEKADAMEPGVLFAIQARTAGTGNQYVYCKKLVANKDGERPLFSGYHSAVSAYYCGSYITGTFFDARFDGYTALDQQAPTSPAKDPTEFNSPATLQTNNMVSGFMWALQFMRIGERWMIYIPWQCGYGASDYTVKLPDGTTKTILGHSALTFDVVLDRMID
ncbi:MAG: FKBP-type peptidyl-prolyl cis-trans isomerase [Bacteroides sp.]|nr:FKBP-type peptidyl-prolyl cis-trans isomerase [Bacteroides sp.]